MFFCYTLIRFNRAESKEKKRTLLSHIHLLFIGERERKRIIVSLKMDLWARICNEVRLNGILCRMQWPNKLTAILLFFFYFIFKNSRNLLITASKLFPTYPMHHLQENLSICNIGNTITKANDEHIHKIPKSLFCISVFMQNYTNIIIICLLLDKVNMLFR